MDFYLDSNATTPVLPAARAAALAAMADDYANPSSLHTSGLRAHALLEAETLDAIDAYAAAGLPAHVAAPDVVR